MEDIVTYLASMVISARWPRGAGYRNYGVRVGRMVRVKGTCRW
jgi:hypothetical protein